MLKNEALLPDCQNFISAANMKCANAARRSVIVEQS
jgi:hypothetical protein